MSRTLSLCTGYGGLDLAVEAVTGARTIAVSDCCKFDKKGNAGHSDPHRGPCAILAHRFPDIPNLGDLKNIDWAAWAGTEVMTAGYPCQPFSHAGKREGTDDPRHIFPFIARGIRIVGPRLVVLENVRGHLGLGFDVVLGTLADIRYDVRWVCLPASGVGAPHQRERLFVVATPADSDGSGLQERWHKGAVRPELVGARAAIDGGRRSLAAPDTGRGQLAGAAVEDDGLLVTPERGRLTPPDTGSERHGRREDSRGLGRLDGPHESSPRERERSREILSDRGAEAATDAGSERLGEHPEGSPAEEARSGGRDLAGDRGGERPDTDWGPYLPAVNRWAAVLGRPAPNPTEPGAKGQPRLSPRFVEWMMGLPEGWVTGVPGLTRNEMLKALGNGVCPQQAASALAFLLKSEEKAA